MPLSYTAYYPKRSISIICTGPQTFANRSVQPINILSNTEQNNNSNMSDFLYNFIKVKKIKEKERKKET